MCARVRHFERAKDRASRMTIILPPHSGAWKTFLKTGYLFRRRQMVAFRYIPAAEGTIQRNRFQREERYCDFLDAMEGTGAR